MSSGPDQSATEHDHQTLQGITFFWAASLSGMIAVVAVVALSGVGSDLAISEIDLIAIGSVNAIGLIAIGGINAIGVVSLGMANSIGVVAIGGVNSIGLITIGGVNSGGVIAIGGVNSYKIFWGFWGATIFDWSPKVRFRS